MLAEHVAWPLDQICTGQHFLQVQGHGSKDQLNPIRNDPLLVRNNLTFNPVWHDIGKQEKCSYLEPPRDKFYKTQ